MKEIILLAEAKIGEIRKIPDILDFEIDVANGFQLITVSLDCVYHDLPAELNKLYVEPRNFFIRVGGLDSNDYMKFDTGSQTFQEVGLETVNAARGHTQHSNVATSKLTAMFNLGDLLEPTGLVLSPRQIIVHIEGMSNGNRKIWLAQHPDHKKIWGSRSYY